MASELDMEHAAAAPMSVRPSACPSAQPGPGERGAAGSRALAAGDVGGCGASVPQGKGQHPDAGAERTQHLKGP